MVMKANVCLIVISAYFLCSVLGNFGDMPEKNKMRKCIGI